MAKINCNSCGRFISKKDLDDGKCGSEDVGDGYEYNGEIWIFTCPDCNTNIKKLTEEDITGLRKVLGDALTDNELLYVPLKGGE